MAWFCAGEDEGHRDGGNVRPDAYPGRVSV
jgi:hypothetical protein